MNNGWSYREQVPAGSGGRTVLAHLAATYRHSTIDDWAERIGRGEVVVDEVVAAPDAILRAGQRLVWHRPPWQEAPVPEHFDVIHEDEAIVAVVKPSGLPTLPAGGFVEHTLLALVRARYPEASPLHRLGRFTSGLVLFARTRSAAATLSRAWRERDVKKYYRALGSGLAALDTITVDAPIGRVPHPTLGDVYAASPEGKPSHSIATVLERRHPLKGCPTNDERRHPIKECPTDDERRHSITESPTNDGTTLFEVEITTGRPHQIRIHLAYAGHPLAGDPLYDAGGVIKPQPGLPGDGGYFLHAERLAFVHPLTGADTVLHASPPPKLTAAHRAR